VWAATSNGTNEGEHDFKLESVACLTSTVQLTVNGIKQRAQLGEGEPLVIECSAADQKEVERIAFKLDAEGHRRGTEIFVGESSTTLIFSGWEVAL